MRLRRREQRLRWGRLCGAAVLLGLLCPPAAAQGGPPAQVAFTGVWRLAADAQEERRRLQAIELATADLSFLIRGTARERLGTRTAPPPELRLEVEGDRLTLSRGGKSLSLRLGGAPVTMAKEGKQGTVSARREGATIVVESNGDNGKMVTSFGLSPDGRRLTRTLRIASERLSRPLVYSSTYLRR